MTIVVEIAAEIAARQHGVATRRQLLEGGLSTSWVDERVRRRELVVLHRGVYLLGSLTGALRPRWTREAAAALACGCGAAISHRNAAALWGLVDPPPSREPVDVLVPAADRGRRPGIRAHRVAHLPRADRATVEGIPTTAPARTLVDLAGGLRRGPMERALARAVRRGLVRADEVRAVLDRRPRAPGRAALLALLDRAAEPAWTRSEAEARVLALIRASGLPSPECNARAGRYEVDFLWRAERVVLEVDGFAFHASRRSFESDRARDRALAARGYRTIRTTWRQITDRPSALLVELAQLLALAGAERRERAG